MTKSEQTVHPHLATHYKRTRAQRRSFTRRRIVRYWPLPVWLAAIAVVVLIHSRHSQFGGMTGVVETNEEIIAPLETARLLEINVVVGQHVGAGDLIARMDPSLLKAKTAEAEAEKRESANSIAGYQRDILSLMRRFSDAVNDSSIKLLNIKTRQSSDIAELDELKKEQARRDQLASRNIISVRDLAELRPKIAGLEQRIKSYPAMIEIEQRRLDRARADMQNLKHWLRLKNDQDLSEAIQAKLNARNKIIDAKLAVLGLRAKNYNLTASRSGTVARIQASPGEIVRAGQPVVRIVSDRATRVVGFLPEVFIGSVHPGTKAVIWRERDGKRMDAVVESVAPDVRTLPGRITPMNARTIRGRRVVLTVSGSPDLIPGETVKIRPGGDSLPNLRQIFGSKE